MTLSETSIENQTPGMVLSQEELIYVIGLLKGESIPGLDLQSFIDLNQEEKELVLMITERALRARGLAAMDEEGQLLLNRQMLDLVTTCLMAEKGILCQFLPKGEGPGEGFNVFGNQGQWVAKWMVQPGLYSVITLPNEEQLLETVLAATSCQTLPGGSFTPLAFSEAVLAEGRRLAAENGVEPAARLWVDNGGDPQAAAAVAGLLHRVPDVAVIHLFNRKGEQAEVKSMTIILDQACSVLLQHQNNIFEVAPFTTDDMTTMIKEWLAE